MKRSNLTPEQAAHAGQIGELLERTARSSAGSDADRSAASEWWADQIAKLRKLFSQIER